MDKKDDVELLRRGRTAILSRLVIRRVDMTAGIGCGDNMSKAKTILDGILDAHGG
jgi:hypothetical protein